MGFLVGWFSFVFWLVGCFGHFSVWGILLVGWFGFGFMVLVLWCCVFIWGGAGRQVSLCVFLFHFVLISLNVLAEPPSVAACQAGRDNGASSMGG